MRRVLQAGGAAGAPARARRHRCGVVTWMGCARRSWRAWRAVKPLEDPDLNRDNRQIKLPSMLNNQARAPTPDPVRRLRTPTVARRTVAIPLLRRPDAARPRGRCTDSLGHGCRPGPGLRSLLCSLRACACRVWLLHWPPSLFLRLAVPMRRPPDAAVVAPEHARDWTPYAHYTGPVQTGALTVTSAG